MPEKLNNFDPTNLQELFSVEGPREETDASPVETIGSTTQNSKTTTPKENSTSKHKEHKKPKRQESKTSREQEAKRTRAVKDDDGHVRSPHNITMRDDYYKALQYLALKEGSAARMWVILDEAVSKYLDEKGLLTPSGRVKI